jgi:hypothetical protein
VNLVIVEKSAAFLKGNLRPATMIGSGVPEVKLHLRLVQIAIYPSMMHNAASPRITSRRRAVTIGLTFAMSLKIGGVLESEHHLHRNGT